MASPKALTSCSRSTGDGDAVCMFALQVAAVSPEKKTAFKLNAVSPSLEG
jgi:hypothetical protein